MKQRGFTVIELLVAVVVLIGAVALFASQKKQLESMNNDDRRRTAINAMYYNLEDVYFKEKGYYPRAIDEKNLTAMDAALFTDPGDIKLGESGSSYKYDPVGCDGDKCTGYSLRADLENEDDFVKENRDKKTAS